ncbi:hypothetical protein ENKO_443 [Klebsiella phage fENko-Kae01]|nr:hypothetical protein [Klebsiella phage fENko-Kae01]
MKKPMQYSSELDKKQREVILRQYFDNAIKTAEYMISTGTDVMNNNEQTTLEEAKLWCLLHKNHYAITFYDNDIGSQDIRKATNFAIEFPEDEVFERSAAVIDVFPDRILLCNELCDDVPLSEIDISFNELDEGYHFQMEATLEIFPFTFEQFKTLFGIAKKLKQPLTKLES